MLLKNHFYTSQGSAETVCRECEQVYKFPRYQVFSRCLYQKYHHHYQQQRKQQQRVYTRQILPDVNVLRQRLIDVWAGVGQSVINDTVARPMAQMYACVDFHNGIN